jgi:hypothetical protein
MAEFPEDVHDLIAQAVAEHPNDIPAAVEEAERRLRALPDFADLVAQLITQAVQDLVYQRRGMLNVALRREAGDYDTKPRTKLADSPDTLAVWDNVYNYFIDGRTLGDLRGNELQDIEASERNVARGHEFNAELCRWLREQGVVDDRRVKDVVSERKLRTAFRRLRKAVFGEQAEYAQAGH